LGERFRRHQRPLGASKGYLTGLAATPNFAYVKFILLKDNVP
jgi:hypothetical protein